MFSKEKVIETINCVASDESLDNSASLKTSHVDSHDAGNESVTNSLRRKKEVNCTKCKFS